MLFLLYLLGGAYVGKVRGTPKTESLLDFAFLVKGDSPQDVAEQLGGEYDTRHEDIFVPISDLQEKPGTGRWKYERGNICFEVFFDHLHSNPYRPDGLKLSIMQVKSFSEQRVKEAV